jgi:predicted transcriptional regulator
MNQDILTGLKWELIKEISKKETNPLELSKKVGKSLPNVSQQLQFLEAVGIIKKRKLNTNERNKPRVLYSINQSKNFITLLNPGMSGKKSFDSEIIMAFIRMLFYTNETIALAFMKTYFEYDIFNNNSLALISHSKDEFTLLIISESKHELINKMHNAKVKINNNIIKIKTQVYTSIDFEDAASNKNKHLLDLLNSKIIYEPSKQFHNLKK